jgi:hypothetical protein
VGTEYKSSNVDNLNKKRHDATRRFRIKSIAYLKTKIEKLETISKINNTRELYRGINDLKNGYQPRTLVVKVLRKIASLQTPTELWRGGGTISPRY